MTHDQPGPAIELPALYRAADGAAVEAQLELLKWTRIRIGGLIAAAVGGAVAWRLRSFDIFGLVSMLGFLAALLSSLHIARAVPDRRWYLGRAAAESIKTLAWRYMVGGAPFAVGESDTATTDSLFSDAARDVLETLRDFTLPLGPHDHHLITDSMRALRAQPLSLRTRLFIEHRVLEQMGWYREHSQHNQVRAHQMRALGIWLEGLGLIMAALKAFQVVRIDLLGIAATVAGGVLAWARLKQYEALASAYSVAALELSAIHSDAATSRSEEEWAAFVNESEEAISREHTLWRASRGVA